MVIDKIIMCPNCGQKNRLKEKDIAIAKCGNCWTLLDNNASSGKTNKSSSNNSSSRNVTSFYNAAWFYWLLAIAGFVMFIFIQENSKSSSSSSHNYEYNKPTFNYLEQPLPYNGAIKEYTTLENIAPLKIKTSYGSHYLVKLKDFYTKKPIMTIFIQGGNDITTKVPLGTFEITYASGEKWYGYNHLFGPDTGYSKADETFSFLDTGYQISGYTISLYRVTNGNLRTSYISPSKF